MRLENIARKISFARESKTRYLLPLDNFIHKVNSAGTLVDFIEEHDATKQIKQDARKYFVIACVNAMETYFKNTARIFIESNWVNEGLFDLLRQEKISLADLREINKRQMSLGEIISVTYSFQDLELINRFYSKMFGINNFIKELENLKVELESDEIIILNKDYPHFRLKINELIELRHLIIHHEGYKGVLGLNRLFEMGKNLVYFVFAADNYILERVPAD